MEANLNEKIKMENKNFKGITIKKEVSDIRTSFESSVGEFDFQEFHHNTNVYSNSYDGDDEVFLETEETSERVRITREPRPRRISDVIDSLGDGEALGTPKDSAHFTFPDFNEGTSDFSSVPNPLSSSRFQSPPVTPGSDVGYYSTGLSTPSSTLNYKLMWSRISTPTMEEIFKADDETDVFKWDDTDAKPINQGEIDINRPLSLPKSKAKIPVAKDSMEYNMNHKKRGWAVIFNNKTFKTNQPRKGSNVDVENLRHTLQILGFEVAVHEDLGFEEIVSVVEQLKKRDYSDADCFVLAVMTHGRLNNYLQSKDHLYPLEMVWKSFSSDNCSTLAGKPKIFLIQACKGDQVDGGTQLVSMTTETDSMENNSYTIPTMADFLIAYSTVEGYFSWRNPESGTWFINSLCEVINEYHYTTDLLKMLTIVARRVAIDFESYNENNPTYHGQKQVPSIYSTLTRDIYFRPKI